MTVNISKPSINIREKLSELDKPSGIAGEAVLRADSVQEIRDQIGAGRKNLIINGGMQVSQRGGSSTFGQSDKGYKTVDRFSVYEQGTPLSTFDVNRVTDSPNGFRSSHKLTCTTAEATPSSTVHMYTFQKIEGQSLQHLGFGTPDAKDITISFWVKATVVGTYAVAFKHFSSNGVGTQYYGDTYTVNSANTWQKVIMVIPKNTAADIINDSTGGFSCEFVVVSGTYYSSSATGLPSWTASPNAAQREGGHNVNLGSAVGNSWQITGVQLELGSVATDFEHRSYGEELALCQRYYYAINGAGNAGYNMILQRRNGNGTKSYQQTIEFPVTMRVSPATAATYLDLHKPGVAYDPITSIGFASSPEMGAAHIMVQTANIDSIAAQVRNFNIQFDAEL